MTYLPTPIVSVVSTTPSSVLVGTSIFGQLPAGSAVIGSVATLQGTNPWITTFSNSSILTSPVGNQSVSGTVLVNNGSVVAFQGTAIWNTSSVYGNVSGSVVAFSTTPSSMLVGASIVGLTPVSVSNTNLNVGGSVVAFQATTWSGSVLSQQLGTRVTSVVSSTPSSMLVGASIFGQLPAGTATLGSVVAYQGIPSWNVGGSVLSQQLGTNIGSVVNSIPSSMLVGSYAHRNDGVASFLGGNLTWNPIISDSAGRIITKPFASEDSTIITYNGSVVSASVTLIQASALGKRNYVTDFVVINTGAVSQLITFLDGSTSVLGYAAVGATSNFNGIGWSIPLKTAPAQDLAFKATGTSSVVYLTLKGFQAP